MSSDNSRPSSSHVNRSRGSSTSSIRGQQHRPAVPSNLRNTQVPPISRENSSNNSPSQPPASEETAAEGQHPQQHHHSEARRDVVDFEQDGLHPYANGHASSSHPTTQNPRIQGQIDEPPPEPSARSRLLDFTEQKFHYPHDPGCNELECNHGTMSPGPRQGGGTAMGYGSFAGGNSNHTDYMMGTDTSSRASSSEGFGGHAPEARIPSDGRERLDGVFGEAITDGLLGKASRKSTTKWLAQRNGVKRRGWMYVAYYLPIMQWLPQYRLSYLRGDIIAALSMASFYVPMALSYASNLAHTPPVNGLYAFVFNPLLYAVLGTCPQMVVGPEAAGSLLTGSVVTEAIKRGHVHDDDGIKQAQVAGMVTGLSGAIILVAGLCRLGFLDGVLSRPFLRGFISAIGITIFIGQLITEMGLDKLAEHSQRAQHGSSLDKILFLADHGHEAHRLTCTVSFTTIAIVLVIRQIKRRLQPRMNWIAYIPDRFIIVVLTAIITWKQGWDKKGLDIMGDIRTQGRPFQVHFPFDETNFKHVDDAFSTALLIAMLGFFESCVAAKSLGSGPAKSRTVIDKDGKEVEEPDGITGMSVSPNRELVALGVANLIGGLFMAIPAFGGYGRSKVNVQTGGKTPMSSVLLSIITIFCVVFLLPYVYYIPKATLSAMLSVVAISLIEEAPHEIHFFYKISGWIELFLMFAIFLVTFFWNLRIGIVVGIGLSLLRMLRHSTRPRIQILGRVPGTREFDNAEVLASEAEEGVEMVPHCLIIKIPEPLTFANTGHLKDRLRRLEDHGTSSAHPALPRVRRPTHNQNIIFDVHGVTALDPAAAQVLMEIVAEYVERGTSVHFCRLPSRKGEVWRLMKTSGIVELCGGERNFHRSVDAALLAVERNSTLVFGEGDDEEENGGPVSDEIRQRLRRKSAAAPEDNPLAAVTR